MCPESHNQSDSKSSLCHRLWRLMPYDAYERLSITANSGQSSSSIG
jgi:hypothetical protein